MAVQQFTGTSILNGSYGIAVEDGTVYIGKISHNRSGVHITGYAADLKMTEGMRSFLAGSELEDMSRFVDDVTSNHREVTRVKIAKKNVIDSRIGQKDYDILVRRYFTNGQKQDF